MPLRSVTMVVGSCYAQVALITNRLFEILCGVGCEESRARLLVVGVAELVNNVIEHALDGRPDHDIVVEIQADEQQVHIRLTDRGAPAPPDLLHRVRPPRVDPDDIDGLPERGMGLYIASQLFERIDWQTRDGANILSVVAPLAVPAGVGA